MCMFWKRFMKCETKPAEDADDFETVEYQLAQATIKSLKQQLTHKTDLADAHKEKYEREQARVAELTAENDQLRDNYERLFGKVSDALWSEVEEEDDEPESDDNDDEPAESVGEETAVFDSAAYGER